MSFLTGERTGAVATLDARIFGARLRRDIVHRVVVWQEKNARTTLYKTKTRAQVRGGGRKPWKQKGTGRARHGSIRSPLWRGGGKAHGPVLRDWSIELPKKVRRLGLRVALSAKYTDRRLIVVDSLSMAQPAGAPAGAAAPPAASLALIREGKTRELLRLMDIHRLAARRVVFIDGGLPPLPFRRAVRNLRRAKPLSARSANVRDIVLADTLILTTDALREVQEHLLQDFA